MHPTPQWAKLPVKPQCNTASKLHLDWAMVDCLVNGTLTISLPTCIISLCLRKLASGLSNHICQGVSRTVSQRQIQIWVLSLWPKATFKPCDQSEVLCVCAGTCVYIHEPEQHVCLSGGQMSSLVSPSITFHLIFQNRVSHWVWLSQACTSPGSICLCLPVLQWNVYAATSGFHRGAESPTQDLVSVQALYRWSDPLGPQRWGFFFLTSLNLFPHHQNTSIRRSQ